MDFYPNLKRYVSLTVFGLGDLDPIFRVASEFSLKCVLNQ